MLTDVIGVDLIVGEKYKIRADGGTFTNVGAADNNIGTEFVADGTTPTAWLTGELELISCNSYIDDLYEQETINLATKFINNSKNVLKSKTLLANHSVIAGVAADKVTKNSRFVGFVLQPMEGNNVKNIIKKLGFLGDHTENFTLYLYETSQKAAIATFIFDYTTANSQQWKAVSDFIVKYDNTELVSGTSYKGGVGQKYVLGYYEDDITGQAFKMNFNQSLKHFSVFGKYLSVYPVEIPSTKLDGTNIPGDLDSLSDYMTDETHGLYFKFTAQCDYTNLLNDNIEMFSESLQYAIAIRILEDAIASVSDGVHNPTKDSAVPEWERFSRKYKGILFGGNIQLGQELKYEKGLLELLTADFSNIDKVCMKHNPQNWQIGNLV